MRQFKDNNNNIINNNNNNIINNNNNNNNIISVGFFHASILRSSLTVLCYKLKSACNVTSVNNKY